MMETTVDELLTLSRPIPRYTSYPTAPEWSIFSPEEYQARLLNISESLSLYIHIPFCKTMCLYCACSVVLNRKPENEERYVQYLLKEIDLVQSYTGKKRVAQLHFGGGTPTQLTLQQFDRIMAKLHEAFVFDVDAEIAIEIDPRTVGDGEKLRHLKILGFNRVSFGVQDTDPRVQDAVRRRQSYEMTKSTYEQARALGFTGINMDLIYGLPHQTVMTFSKTVEEIIQLRPDRIALFSYAKVPWLKAHQKAIPDSLLPTTEEKFQIYLHARRRFIEAGYKAIGMDHFALESDELIQAYHKQTLTRNFQGYSVLPASDMLGLGITAIGSVQDAYVQNVKELTEYYQLLDERVLPVHRGKVLSEDDRIRRYVIHTLMCQFKLCKKEFQKRFDLSFDEYFQEERKRLIFVEEDEEKIQVTKKGELFIRNVASTFDKYLHKENSHKKFSQSI